MENEFYKDYKERVMPALQRQHGYKNVHQVPKVEKVVINNSVGSQADVKQALEDAKPELDKIKRNIGFDVTIVTTARTNAEAKSLLSEMGMPFSDRAKKLATVSPSEGGPTGQAQAA